MHNAATSTASWRNPDCGSEKDKVMFYEPEKDDHGLPFNPFKSIVVPRPIGWISTISLDGIVNLAPFSHFKNLAHDPPYVMFSANSAPQGQRQECDRYRRVRRQHGDLRAAGSRQHHLAIRSTRCR